MCGARAGGAIRLRVNAPHMKPWFGCERSAHTSTAAVKAVTMLVSNTSRARRRGEHLETRNAANAAGTRVVAELPGSFSL